MGSGEEGGRSHLDVPPVDVHTRASLLRHLVESGVPVDEFRLQSFSLEEIYMRLTLEQEVIGGAGDGANGADGPAEGPQTAAGEEAS
jgi:hypothetical protein